MPAINPEKFKTPMTWYVLISSMIMIAMSCRMLQPEHQLASSAPPSSAAQERFSAIYSGSDSTSSFKLADFALSNCEGSEDGLIRWRFDIPSYFGRDTLVLESAQTSPEKLKVYAGENTFELKNHILHKMPAELTDAYCQNKRMDEKTSAAFTHIFANWLEAAAPDCQFDFAQDNEWFCHLPTVEAALADQELDGILSTMIRRWNRQPYLITRRLTVTKQLANALNRSETLSPKHLASICRIIGLSLPEELPLVLSSPAWQAAVCSDDATFAHEAAQVGLSKSLSEIEFIRQLFERTSRLGMLTVRVPRSDAPSRSLWVSLLPGPDVKESLALESSQLWKEMQENNGSGRRRPGCWHPLFNHASELLPIAQHLDIIGSTSLTECSLLETTPARAESDHERFNPHLYLADSITSETEFVVTNGNAKLLRLPAGSYQYSMRGYNEGLSEETLDEAIGQVASGSINWTQRRPRATISQWQEQEATEL